MKQIKITGDRKLSSIQEEFNSSFPYLKLEFFKHKHTIYQGNAKKDMLTKDGLLKQSGKKSNEGEIIVKENMRVSELEGLFQHVFGISTQLFRKSGNSWIETSVTDDWTLKQQNDQGNELSHLAR